MKHIQRCNSMRALILFLGVLAWTSVSAIQLGEGLPLGLIEAQGIMRYLDLPGGSVQIDDQRYKLAPDTVWYGLDPKNPMGQLLRAVNRKVAFIEDSEQKTPTINAIWILPSEGR